MTSTAPGAHPLPEEVDALLDPSGGDAQVGAHVAVCDRCAAVREDLLLVRTLLGDQARTPPPEPPDLGARIAAALAAEPPLTRTALVDDRADDVRDRSRDSDRVADLAAARDAVEDRSGSTVVSLDSRRRRPWTTWLAAAASVAVLGAGGTFLVTQLGTGGSQASGAAAEAPGAVQDERVTEGGIEQQGGEDAGGPAAPQAPLGSEPASSQEDEAFTSSGRAYDAADLPVQAQALLTAAESGSRPGPQSLPDTGYELSTASTLEACLVSVGRPGAEPVVTDLATFEGQDAAVVVLAGR